MSGLALLILVGAVAYANQFRQGLIATNTRDHVSWAFYVGNFTFLVGDAAAAASLVIPAYVYQWRPIKEVVLLGELLAISALVLNAYLMLNVVLVAYILLTAYRGAKTDNRILMPLVLLSIPVAISTRTVTACLYNGRASRPYWNASILAPRFVASAFCSGPAVMLNLFQILRRTVKLSIKNEAIWKIAELIAYAMFLNRFLLGAEVFKEFHSATEHTLYTRYLRFGICDHRTLGEIYEYRPTINKWCIAAGIFGVGFLILTFLVKIAVPAFYGTFRVDSPPDNSRTA